jgi:hypothetical protein
MLGLRKLFDARRHFVQPFNIASWREEMRCIQKKQTPQQPKPTHVSRKMSMLLHARGFDLDVDCDCLADSRNRFRALAEH